MFLNKLAVQLALAINAPKDYNKRKKQRDEGEKQNGATNIYGYGIRKPQKNNTAGSLYGIFQPMIVREEKT